MKKIKSSDLCRMFFAEHNVYRYRTKKVDKMSDDEIGRYCHWFCEDNKLTDEWRKFVSTFLAEYRYCPYSHEYLDVEYCYNLQMIATGMIVDDKIISDKSERFILIEKCNECIYKL